MRLTLLIAILLITSYTYTIAQSKVRNLDVITTKSGNVYKGHIIEDLENEYLRIEILGGSIFTIDYTEIVKRTKELKHIDKIQNSYAKGFKGKIEFAAAPRTNEWYGGIRIAGGYQFNSYLTSSLGIGFHNIEDRLSGASAFVQLSGSPKWAVAPYYAFDFGYTIFTQDLNTYDEDENKTDGNYFFGTDIGIRINSKKNIDWIITTGLHIQNVSKVEKRFRWNDQGVWVAYRSGYNYQIHSPHLALKLIF